MWSNVPLFPPQASTFAPRVDALYYFLTGMAVFFTGLISILILVFAVKYRRRSRAQAALPPRTHLGDLRLELAWSLVPLGLMLVVYVWGASLYFTMSRPPATALEVHAIGKQWMWKFQHLDGRREINELHVPVRRPVKVILASQDVIHSFYVPAFRVKQDVVPGRYTVAWFEATRPGTYHLFCAEYCGTVHSGMIGRVVVLDPVQYQEWLSGGVTGEPLALAGERLFQQLGCVTCHRADVQARGPALTGVFGKQVRLASGDTVLADEAYVREAILQPNAKVVAGYAPIMPTFQGQISEEGILQLIAYIRSLGGEERQQTTP